MTINAVLIMIMVAGNVYIQVMCIPVLWAAIVIGVVFLHSVFLPYTSTRMTWAPVTGLLSGLSFCVFIYCFIFLEMFTATGLLSILMIIGLVGYIPLYFAVQSFWKSMVRPVSGNSRIWFSGAVAVCLSLFLYAGYSYWKTAEKIQMAAAKDFEGLETGFMTEKILGMHFIYHTQFCEYDGSRPPFHEPFLVAGLWQSGMRDPLSGLHLPERIELYKKIFPSKPVRFNCSCAISYSVNYFGGSWLQ